MRSAAASGLQRPRGIETHPATAAARASARSPPTRRASSRSASRSRTAWTVPCPPATREALAGGGYSETKATVAPFNPPLRTRGNPHLSHDAPEMKILVVDDEPAVRDARRARAALEGYDVLLAADGARGARHLAARAARRGRARRVMPRVDGLEVCRRHAPARRPHAGADAHRARRGRRPRRRASTRAPTTTWSSRSRSRAAGAGARAAAPRRARRDGGAAALRRPRARPGRARGPPRRAARSSSRAPSSCCSTCSCATRARC